MGLAEKGDKKGGCGNHLGRVHIAGCAVIGGVEARPTPEASTHTAVNRDGEGAGAGIENDCGWFLPRQAHRAPCEFRSERRLDQLGTIFWAPRTVFSWCVCGLLTAEQSNMRAECVMGDGSVGQVFATSGKWRQRHSSGSSRVAVSEIR